MTPDVVVDVGNSRIKWGRCTHAGVTEVVSLSLDSIAAWENQQRAWEQGPGSVWVAAGVNPLVQSRFADWVREAGGRLAEITNYRQVPLGLAVHAPEQVGIDRLLTALAAHRLAAPRPAVVLNVGTATTADVTDASGTFLGGAILPGPQLMARSLHEHTAKLPLIDVTNLHTVLLPGHDTKSAIEAGILAATAGAFRWLLESYAGVLGTPPVVYLTGGGVRPFLDTEGAGWTPDPDDTRYAPTLTLEGIRLAAEALP